MALGDLHAKNGNFFCEGTLGMANPQPFMQYVLTLYCQTLIPRTKTHTHTRILPLVNVSVFWGSGEIALLWISTVPVRLYWNWKQFSLRRQGRTCESSAHVLEFSEGLSRWRVLLCVEWGSHDCENQRAGRVRMDPELVGKLFMIICVCVATCITATGKRQLRC